MFTARRTTSVAGTPQRLRIISADGTQRQLSDLLVALMEGGGFDASEIDTINIDDVIDGASTPSPGYT
ncbi:hypothetical protein BQ8794_100066 [Mesorhizobium prunaredense]|uniref:Uncharacterized protein n=1 Tax=Mesorhizobium prunaredense TaxID=1631249 RepID=A0A1R3UZX8_9HYPH|nr:hypothetical protein [Mesorhizobium prunaredense]SIT53175.1 hypothetical protein BQ8794_100066 [Mesorhizobium prunaredense]